MTDAENLSSQRLEIETLNARIDETANLLVATPLDEDPIGHLEFKYRKESLERRLSRLQPQVRK